LLTGGDPAPEKARAAPRPKPSREAVLALRAEVRRAEERVSKLEEMRGKLVAKLAEPDLYDPGREAERDLWQRKYGEVLDGLERAEALWIAAQERLEEAEG